MESILLVEDESLVSLAEAEALTAAGYLVHPAADGASALAIAKAVGLSAAIIDMDLPDCSGDHVARGLRAIRPSLPILICTGHEAAGISDEIKSMGVCIVEKPIDASVLIRKLREHMRQLDRVTLG